MDNEILENSVLTDTMENKRCTSSIHALKLHSRILVMHQLNPNNLLIVLRFLAEHKEEP